MIKSQWECLLENLGSWSGSFTRLNTQGEILDDVTSVVSLEGLNDNKTIYQVVRRQGQEDLVLEYSSLSRGILFFENGAFCQGTIQIAPFSEFGAEFGLIYQNRRLRLVQLYDTNAHLYKLVLIRETLTGTPKIETPPLTVDALLGEWTGEAITIYPDLRSPSTIKTKLQLKIDEKGKLVQSLTFGDRTISSKASIKGSVILFDENPEKIVQVLMLPGGASATSPQKIQLRQPLLLEIGWLIEPNFRQRMIRSYDDKGEWVSLTLVTEKRE